jgi:hypothetical protein
LPGWVRPRGPRLHDHDDQHQEGDKYIDRDPGYGHDLCPGPEPAAQMELAQVHEGDRQGQHGKDEHRGNRDTRVGPQPLPPGQCLKADTGPVSRAQERGGQRVDDRPGKVRTGPPGEDEELEAGEQNEHRGGKQEPSHSRYQRLRGRRRRPKGFWLPSGVPGHRGPVRPRRQNCLVVHRRYLAAASGTAVVSR